MNQQNNGLVINTSEVAPENMLTRNMQTSPMAGATTSKPIELRVSPVRIESSNQVLKAFQQS